MKRETVVKETTNGNAAHTPDGFLRTLRKRILNRAFCSICAAFGIFGGISSLFVGLICVLIHTVDSGEKVFDRVGTILLLISIPMILIGSIFLDEIEK